MRNMDSWEGWFWGAKHVWGCEPVGEMMPMTNLYPDIAKNSDLLIILGLRPGNDAAGRCGPAAQPPVLLVYEDRA